MNSELIETFVTVANAGNITKSADILFVSQATVSHRIKQLEEKLGIQLILRNKGSKQTNLTIAGKNFLPLAQSWLRLNDEISTFQERPQALELSIGVVDSVNNYLLADFYKELRQDALDWRLTVRTLHTQEIYDHVRQNTIDVGLPLGEQLIAGIQVKKIHTEKLMVVSRRKIKDKNTLFPIDLDTDYQIFIPWGQDYLHWHHRFFPAGRAAEIFRRLGQSSRRTVGRPLLVSRAVRRVHADRQDISLPYFQAGAGHAVSKSLYGHKQSDRPD